MSELSLTQVKDVALVNGALDLGGLGIIWVRDQVRFQRIDAYPRDCLTFLVWYDPKVTVHLFIVSRWVVLVRNPRLVRWRVKDKLFPAGDHTVNVLVRILVHCNDDGDGS